MQCLQYDVFTNGLCDNADDEVERRTRALSGGCGGGSLKSCLDIRLSTFPMQKSNHIKILGSRTFHSHDFYDQSMLTGSLISHKKS
jgi:hypothetical protein